MTEQDSLTAVLLQLHGITQTLAELDHREASDIRQLHDRITALTTLVSGIKDAAADQDSTLAAIKAIDQRIDELTAQITGQAGDEEADGYQPQPTRRWWKLEGPERDASIAALRAWVDQIYLPGYGYLAATLGDCWDQHPLCLYALDWLSELWSVLYLQPQRSRPVLAGQAEWQTRLLAAVADQLAHETRRCNHAVTRLPIRTGIRP